MSELYLLCEPETSYCSDLKNEYIERYLAHSSTSLHLQWFAPEDEGRTEDPTEYKLRKAREEGKVAKSADLTSAIILIFCITAIAAFGSNIVKGMRDLMIYFFSNAATLDPVRSPEIGMVALKYFAKISLPLASIAFVAAFFANVFQVGVKFSAKPITPDPSRVLPRFGKWFQRSFMSAEAAFNLMKSIVKVLIIGGISYINIKKEFDHIVGFISSNFLEAFTALANIAFRIMFEAALAMLVFAVIDYRFQRKQHMDSLKMSKQEVKEERKMTEGDPLIKARLKERMRDIMTRDMINKIPEADVVITNPTHFAVVLQWEREKMQAPMVTAKGQDNMAFKIREIAGEHNVPIMENRPLARALYAEVEVGDVIPEQYYQAMAIILAEVYRLRGEQMEAV
ncbi:MAG: flagellar biosynthesis protein FlhB [Spirochaetales bacterium]|nr:flagellar biosynthesis protein FlhB [Spirochaetales bacterium]